ncbi:MAG TPA: hypothetical protein VE090_02280, partial [Methylomirabilota bacterium]|nr:hypothetical protein [Methylomirabilota bacterium]
MKKYIVTCFVFIGIIIAIISGIVSFSSSQSTGTQMAHQTFRQTQAIFLNTKKQAISVEATRLPEFRYDLSDKKFNAILTAGNVLVKQFAKVSIVNKIFAKEKMPAAVSVDQSKKQLVVTPEDMPNLKPGMYHLSLQLRTIEGVVNVEQDFSWGVIAVNTNKSIYKPGETAKIGLGVLNDKGETLCMTGLFNHVDDLSMVITDPQGHAQNFSIKDKTILDSGKCGANTVTNDADFQATYLTKTAGIYQMKVTAVVYGREREIEDYFKVDPSVQFDVERTSFPTRIYPPAPYPVTFTVTAKAEYQGIVEDVVPANFVIDHISDNGQSEKDGDFTK